MKLKEYLKEKKEHRNSESFFCHKENSASFTIAIIFLGIPSIFVYLSLENGDFNFDFLDIFSIIFFAQKSISQFYLLIFEYPAFLYTTDSQLVVWDNFFKKRSIEKNQIKKAYVFDDRHDSSTKLKNALRLELNDGNFFDVCLDYAERKKNKATAMVIISALRCPYESEYEQKTITKLDDEDKEILKKLDDEEKEIRKKEKKIDILKVIFACVCIVYGEILIHLRREQFIDEETMYYAFFAPLFAFVIYALIKINTITKPDDEDKAKLDDEEKEILKKLDDEDKENLKKKEKQNFLTLKIQIILALIIIVSVYLFFDEETMVNVIYGLLFAFLLAFLGYFLIGGDNLKD